MPQGLFIWFTASVDKDLNGCFGCVGQNQVSSHCYYTYRLRVTCINISHSTQTVFFFWTGSVRSVLTVCLLLTAVQLEFYADESRSDTNVKRPLAPSGLKGSDRLLTAALAYFQTGVTLLAVRCPYHITPRKQTQDCNPPLYTSVPLPEYSVSYLILCYQPPHKG